MGQKGKGGRKPEGACTLLTTWRGTNWLLPSIHAVLPQHQGVAGAWAEPKINYFSLVLFIQTFFHGNEKPTHTQNASLKKNVKPTGAEEAVKRETLWPHKSRSLILQDFNRGHQCGSDKAN